MQDLLKLGGQENLWVAAENKVNEIYGTKYHINFGHPILTDHGIFYLQTLNSDLVFEATLAPASQGSKADPTKLKYKLINIQLEPV